MKKNTRVAVIGGGLAGCETAWQLARKKIEVVLFEMRPDQTTPAHKTDHLAELVCSNSLKSVELTSAHGLLKKEMEMAGSLIIECAKQASVPAGSALAVDRDLFSARVQQAIIESPLIKLQREEVAELMTLSKEFDYVVVASGPLTSRKLSQSLIDLVGQKELYFYDAISPVVTLESIDMNIAFKASRYQDSPGDYINCPMDQSQYEKFYYALMEAEKVEFAEYEKQRHFEGCLPIEVMAERGFHTLCYGPFKPVGFKQAKPEKRPFAVLQLRQENLSGSLYNLVGCQTKMTFPEQRRIFRLIPGLENAEFARLGSMHRNTYINAPQHLAWNLSLKLNSNIFLAGQITGVEGYGESTATGLWVAQQIGALEKRNLPPKLDPKVMICSLVRYLMEASTENFQPMNANFGLLSPLEGDKRLGKKERKQSYSERALKSWECQLSDMNWLEP
ncbi:MAG: methylenetetrahydrofolate--tRNA-(uracil(54)-C(5))-methyltransferase (FADH(2)-oxidizing) TrmFO [Deltaproteobacteria bacterium]|nr:methylenetetrahydrofolate--tRNA-(uracil(54)-C(5))-methyltransferase (FADH(2)-oxidizing) TrmFO [Deltaproteobacteria bacterium]